MMQRLVIKNTIIYTDASIRKNSCGLGIWMPLKNISYKYRLLDYKDINNAELIAIYAAISLSKEDHISIYTDSLNAIKLIYHQNHNSKYEDIVYKINKIMNSKEVYVNKVKAHSKDKNNDIADKLAKLSITEKSPYFL
jgi:ribonuclease HI